MQALIAAAVLLLCGAPAQAISMARELNATRWPAANFSPYFDEYERLKETHRWLIVLQSHCRASDIPLLYLRYMGAPARDGFTVLDSQGCGLDMNEARPFLAYTLAQAGPAGLVVLDQKEQSCAGAPAQPAQNVRRLDSLDGCVWLAEPVKSLAEIRAAADAVGFHYAPDMLVEH